MLSINDLFVSLPLYSDGSLTRSFTDKNRLLISLKGFSSEFVLKTGGDWRLTQKNRIIRFLTKRHRMPTNIILVEISLTVNLNANDLAQVWLYSVGHMTQIKSRIFSVNTLYKQSSVFVHLCLECVHYWPVLWFYAWIVKKVISVRLLCHKSNA